MLLLFVLGRVSPRRATIFAGSFHLSGLVLVSVGFCTLHTVIPADAGLVVLFCSLPRLPWHIHQFCTPHHDGRLPDQRRSASLLVAVSLVLPLSTDERGADMSRSVS